MAEYKNVPYAELTEQQKTIKNTLAAQWEADCISRSKAYKTTRDEATTEADKKAAREALNTAQNAARVTLTQQKIAAGLITEITKADLEERKAILQAEIDELTARIKALK